MRVGEVGIESILFAAGALGEDAVGVLSCRGDDAVVGDLDLAARPVAAGTPRQRAAVATEACDAVADLAGEPAAAADALRKDGDRAITERRDVTGALYGNEAAVARRSAILTDAEPDPDILERYAQRSAIGDAEVDVAGDATATTDALCDDAVGRSSKGGDITGYADVDGAAVA